MGAPRRSSREVRNELKRVTWPSRKEVYATTVVVILTSVVFGLYLFALDLGSTALMAWVYPDASGTSMTGTA